MKGHWLRGMLLALTMSLLLAGGVALAHGLWMTADKECVPCYPGNDGIPDKYLLTTSGGGWNPAFDLCRRLKVDGNVILEGCDPPPTEDPDVTQTYFPCTSADGTLSVLGGEVEIGAPVGYLGEWTYRIWQTETGQSAQVSFVVAEDCLADEFVPEPGTIALLGSGLAGLAGYATLRLRWRGRQ